MGYQTSLSLFLSLIACFFTSSSLAYTNFYVGGNDGWVLHPSEPYNHWAERLRFLINDTLVFNYKKGLDSVLQVSKDSYYDCGKHKPLKSMTSGSSVFQFDRPGPFFFISGHKDNCEKGQKLIVIVLHPRPTPVPNPPQRSPTPDAPISPSAPTSKPPKSSPPPYTLSSSLPPASEIPSASPSPLSPPPSTSTPPSSSPPHAPSSPPTSSTPLPYAPSSPPTSSTPLPYAPSYPPTDSSGPVPSEKTPAPAPEEDNNNAHVSTPAPAPSASSVVSSSSVMAFVVSLLVCGVFFG